MTLSAFVFPKLRTLKTRLDKCLKSSVSGDPLTSNMTNVPNHCWSLHNSSFIILSGHKQGDWVGKYLSYWHAKSWDCFLTHWLPIKKDLFLNMDNLTLPIQTHLSQNRKAFSKFFAPIFKSSLNFKRLEKTDDPHSVCISKITDSENVFR